MTPLAAGIVVLLLSSCANVREQVKAPDVSVGDVRVTGMSLTGAQIAVDLIVKNPNGFALAAENLTYAMKLQDRPFFEGALGERLRVDAGKSSRVSLPFSVRYEDVLGSIAALRDNRELRYRLNGKVDFGMFNLPYSKEGKIALPRLPDISVQTLQVSQLNLTGVELTIKLKVNNPNAFPVRLDDLNYDLKLAGSALMHGQSAQPIAVGARSDGTTSLKMRVDYSQVQAVLEKSRNARSLPIEFNGQVRVPGLKEGTRLPYAWSGEVPLVRK